MATTTNLERSASSMFFGHNLFSMSSKKKVTLDLSLKTAYCLQPAAKKKAGSTKDKILNTV